MSAIVSVSGDTATDHRDDPVLQQPPVIHRSR
jgi:hypothetical protein